MNVSAFAWQSIERLRRVSPSLAVLAANLAGGGRSFHVDADGDWIARQDGVTIASPDTVAKRLSFMEAEVADYFLPFYQPKADDVVVDVGAGIGEEAVVISHKVKRYIAIEASPRTYRCLSKTIALSGLPAEPIHCAIGDMNGTTTIETTANHLGNSIGRGDAVVEMRSLSSLCADLGIKRIDFLKMNIEGAEQLAVKGLGALDVRNAAISCHDFINMETKQAVKAAMCDFRQLPRRHHLPWINDTLYFTR
ncbi:FkbM family methyltransferase [Sphingomonas sp. HDW15A]|uniref:FkbM family methyltransferase n=1 Tax=Sphingomonas sp. HDW15A TaxID=2714942 RepID=UPI0014095AFD|nr:FkbM family methyltransferase [Sphingomonas sp. HDW15A]QIK95841.1 FkbM family methyltransferase [Sphingomonas sp. HDW15A]